MEWPNRLTDVEPDIYASCGLLVISSVSNFILLEMALLSEHLQADGFKSLWYSNFVYT